MERSLSIKPDTTAKELAELIKTENANVCKQVAQHPNTSPETLKSLFVNFPVEVLNNPIMDLLLLENPNFYRELYYSNPDCFIYFTLPLFYIEWAINNIEDYWVRYIIAESIKTPLSILEKLALDKNDEVRFYVASNPNISENIVNQLAKDKNKNVLYNLAINSKTSHKNLELLAKHEQNNIRSAVVCNHNIPVYVIEKLSEDSCIDVVRTVARNWFTPLKILKKLSQHKDTDLRSDVATNPNISLDIMNQLMKDSEESVRVALARNEKMPSDLLNELAKNAINSINQLSEKSNCRFSYKILCNIVSKPNATLGLKNKLCQSCIEEFNASQEFDFERIKFFTDLEMIRVNWTKEIGRDHLLRTYGKRSRLHLTDAELVEFLHYLRDLPTPDIE